MVTLDAIDRKILSLLQTDSRMTMQELADKVGLSVSPCHRRVKLLEERGVITRYIATVDQKSLGLHVSVFISIKLARQKEEDLNRFARDLEMGRGAGVLSDDGQPRLPAARGGCRSVVL
jgi:Lrp/AsnC family transcriptional regulator, leucine-responsive regulatory protein